METEGPVEQPQRRTGRRRRDTGMRGGEPSGADDEAPGSATKAQAPARAETRRRTGALYAE